MRNPAAVDTKRLLNWLNGLPSRFKGWLRHGLDGWLGGRRVPPARRAVTPELQQALALIAAVDAGGVPMMPGKVNHIARSLGLEVSGKAPVEDTIRRIREAIGRGAGPASPQ